MKGTCKGSVGPALALLLALCSRVNASDAELPQTITAKCTVSSYGFLAVDRDYHIDQVHPGSTFDIELKRADRSLGYGTRIPGWKGAKTVALRGGYQVRVDAHFLFKQPQGDFAGDLSGIALDISYCYDDELLGFQAVSLWSKEDVFNTTAQLMDTAYLNLMKQNKFPIPSQFSIYSDGFRFWAAVRDGLEERGDTTSFKSLTAALAPLKRDKNLMIPTVIVNCELKKPAGQ